MKCTLFNTGCGLVWIRLSTELARAETNTAEGRIGGRRKTCRCDQKNVTRPETGEL